MNRDTNSKYPYVIVRYIAAVYCQWEILFVVSSEEQVAERGAVAVICSKPFENGRLTEMGLDAAVVVVQELCRKLNHHVCLVLEKDRCIYFDAPTGKVSHSTEPPSGGVDLPYPNTNA